MSKVALHTLGCKVNTYETEVMKKALEAAGYTCVEFNDVADVYVINTCSVTDVADSKSRQMIHRAKKLNPDALVVAAGCYVQASYEKLAEDETIDILVGNNCKRDIVDILERYERLKLDGSFEKATLLDRKTLFGSTLVDVKNAVYEECSLEEFESQTRAYIKIQDGCDAYCTYCIIPYTRGRNRSRERESIFNEVKTLVSKGCCEFVLTGIHVSFYEYGLAELIRDICNMEGARRLRLSSLEPRVITKEFMDIVSACPEFCPHFHLSLQSGSDTVLKRMNRKYTSEEYMERVDLIRSYYPDAAITTDIITGFPGETEEEHLGSVDFAKKVSFSQIHVFAFSSRKGTFASKMDDKISKAVKSERSADLIEVSHQTGHEFRERFIGRKVSVLFEEPKMIDGKEYWTGYTPEYIKVYAASSSDLHGVIREVTIENFLTPASAKTDEAEGMLGIIQ